MFYFLVYTSRKSGLQNSSLHFRMVYLDMDFLIRYNNDMRFSAHLFKIGLYAGNGMAG